MRKKLLCRLLCAALLCALPCGSASAGIPEDAAALTAKIAQPSIPQDVRVNVEELGAISADRKDDLPDSATGKPLRASCLRVSRDWLETPRRQE